MSPFPLKRTELPLSYLLYRQTKATPSQIRHVLCLEPILKTIQQSIFSSRLLPVYSCQHIRCPFRTLEKGSQYDYYFFKKCSHPDYIFRNAQKERSPKNVPKNVPISVPFVLPVWVCLFRHLPRFCTVLDALIAPYRRFLALCGYLHVCPLSVPQRAPQNVPEREKRAHTCTLYNSDLSPGSVAAI